VGDALEYKSVVGDPTQFRPFESNFQVKVLEPFNRPEGVPGTRKKPPSSEEGTDRSILSSLSLPQVIEIHQNRWSEVKFTENSALLVKDTGDEGYDFYVNMDNICLLSEVKARSDIDGKLLSGRYKYALVLIGLALLKEHADSKEEKKNDEDILKEVSEVSEKLSPIILPMISYLGELEIES
jgi:hypothetical protein